MAPSFFSYGELVRRRPSTKHLTEFYLWMSFGGVLGGIFNALIAPVVFNTVAEYPVALFLSALLLPLSSKNMQHPSKGWRSISIYAGSLIFIGLLSFYLITRWPAGNLKLDWINGFLGIERRTLISILTYGVLALLCFCLVFLKRPLLFGISMGTFILGAMVFGDWGQRHRISGAELLWCAYSNKRVQRQIHTSFPRHNPAWKTEP